jgi:N-acyl-D-amino-acid deacylase
MVDRAMEEGAVGLSTGLIYLPGTFSKTEEIIELAKVAARHDGIYTSHMRNEGLHIIDALNELIRVASEAQIRAEVSHIKLSGKSAWGRANQVLAVIEKARDEGLDITQDQYMYTASSTGIGTLIPSDVREGGREKLVARLADPVEKTKIVTRMKEILKTRGQNDYGYAVIASYATDATVNGKTIPQVAKQKRGSDSLDDQIELILEIESSGGASGVFHGIAEDDLQGFLKHPNTMIASDSSVRAFNEGIPHPRGYGNNARMLARYVRELHLLRLEDAIRRMTSLPATTFRLKNRGLLREGYWADIVIFDPQKVQDCATFNDPHHYATGIPYVLVNGIAVVANEEHTDARPGRALRN